MPQPVHYSHRIEFQFTPESLLLRPKLAAHIALISAMWNEIEARIGALLAALVGSEAETVISIFVAVRNDAAKRATIDTVAELKMSADEHAQFQEIMKKIGKRYDDRNIVVHGAWGISPAYPEALLWLDIRQNLLFHVEMMSVPDDRRTAALIAEQKKMMVYDERDFISMQERIRVTYEELRTFSRPILERGLGHSARIDLPPKWPRPS